MERYFRAKYMENGNITQIGSYWDRTGHNEIDIIALNEINKTVHFTEIKRNKKNISINTLKEKAANMINKTNRLKDYDIEYHGLSLEDM